MLIKLKRIYELPEKSDGFRILVDRLWPRGVKKESAKIDLWLKDIAPSPDLRIWYGHDPEKWAEFKKNYTKELNKKKDLFQALFQSNRKIITLVFAAKEVKYSHALILQKYMQKKLDNYESEEL
ncbi:DUF488 family protein [Candidatus Berkiella cookevillensis]|uniref:DUF488 family protein n=1 Tax=Candidatus Berkiella cookevillensis TaxID=437022 RepID=A0A0Q9YC95_9GAMM|nr:DUF488 family protein [Candidatus Berkiella cookevillensis]MCS5708688.1 DUF488 family protein [Candidatus Berkiella cookevillensis]